MKTRFLWPCVLAVICGLALAPACLPPVRAQEVLPDAADQAVRALFPDAIVTGVETEIDEGATLYVVRLARGRLTTDLEISAEGTVAEIETELGLEDVPDYMAAAIREATLGGILVAIEKHELHGRVRDGRVVALPEPAILYEVKFVLDGKNRIVEVTDTPALKLPPPARDVVKTTFPDALVRDVSPDREAGLPVYEVQLEQRGRRLEVQVSPDGTVTSVGTKVAPEGLPPAVAQAMARAAGGARIAALEREEVRAEPRFVVLDRPRVVYEAEFTRDGKTYEVTVADDGTIVSVEDDDGEVGDDAE